MKTNPANAHAADSAPFDERGTPADQIKHCETHDVLYRRGGRCLDCERAEKEADDGE